MAAVVIKCPDTGIFVPTGFDMDPQTFENCFMQGNAFQCDVCGRMHTWDKEDAHLDMAGEAEK